MQTSRLSSRDPISELSVKQLKRLFARGGFEPYRHIDNTQVVDSNKSYYSHKSKMQGLTVHGQYMKYFYWTVILLMTRS